MKKYILLTILGALLLSNTPTNAKPYYLHSCNNNHEQKDTRSSKAPKRPLRVDLNNHTLTVPNSVMGYTLILKDEEGMIYTCLIISNTIILPFENLEDTELLIINESNTYTCEL